jgi:methanogen homoisocitrate dehydrogenase
MTTIAIVEGDGIGHEVIPVARDILALLHPEFEFLPVDVGYARWEQTGCPCADRDITLLKTADAILFGAVTTPPMKDYQSVVLRIRKSLDLYANLRPVKGDGFDIMIVRENTEGLYSGIEDTAPERATTLRVVSRAGTVRIARAAIRLARERSGTLTIGHKANVIKSDVFFRDICIEEARAANIPFNDKYIDALSLDILQHPKNYNVVVTTNMFGDILSDVAAYLVGGSACCPVQISGTGMRFLNRSMEAPRILQGKISQTRSRQYGAQRCSLSILVIGLAHIRLILRYVLPLHGASAPATSAAPQAPENSATR